MSYPASTYPLEVARQMYQALRDGDQVKFQSLFHRDAFWHVAGHNPISGTHEGVEAIAQVVLATANPLRARERERRKGPLAPHPFTYNDGGLLLRDLTSSDEHVVSLLEVDIEGAVSLAAHIFEIKEGRIKAVWRLNSDQYEIDERLSHFPRRR